MKRTEWFKRKFAQIEDNGLLPGIIERLEGTSARLNQKLLDLQKTPRNEESTKWSINDEAGHLGDLEELWMRRVLELKSGAEILSEAELTNKKTHETNHDAKTLEALITEFSEQRSKLVTELRSTKDAELTNVSLHPRLKTPMRMIDLAFFVAEHDDHHLAQITQLING